MGSESSKQEKNSNNGRAQTTAVSHDANKVSAAHSPPVQENGTTVGNILASGNAKVNIQRKGGTCEVHVPAGVKGKFGNEIISDEAEVSIAEEGDVDRKVHVHPANQENEARSETPTQETEADDRIPIPVQEETQQQSQNVTLTVRVQEKKETMPQTVPADDPLSTLEDRLKRKYGSFKCSFFTVQGTELDMDRTFKENNLHDGDIVLVKELIVVQSTYDEAAAASKTI